MRTSNNRLDTLLSWGQLITLLLVIVLAVISRPRQVLLEISQQPNIPIEFRMVSLSIPDYFVIILLCLTLARLMFVAAYREHLLDTVHVIVTRLGGIWWMALAVWTVFGLAWALDGTMLRFGLAHLIAMLAMAFILAQTVRDHGLRLPLAALIISACVQSVIAVLQVLNNDPLGLWALGEIDRFYYDPLEFYRAPGLSMHYNYLAGYLMVALFGCIAAGYRLRHDRRLLALMVAAGLLVSVGIASTLSRSAFVATAVGLLPVIVMLLWRAERRTRWLVIGGVGVLALVGAAWLVIALGSFENFQTRFLTGREFFFDYSWAVIQESPVLGVGAGNLMLAAGLIWGMTVQNLLPVHNVYLFVWAEQGLPGLALYLAGCAAILWRLRPRYGGVVLIWTCCFLAVCVVNLFDNYFWAVHPHRAIFFWVVGLWWGVAYEKVAPPVAEVVTPAAEAAI